MGLDLVKSIIDFRQSYRTCKKLRSRIVKDSYDKEFLIPIIKKYKSSALKGKRVVQAEDLKEFFEYMISVTKNWMSTPDKKKSDYKLSERKNAVNNLKAEAEKCLSILNKPPKKPIPNPFKAPEFKKATAKAAPVEYNLSVVNDFEYEILGLASLNVRCYILFKFSGGLAKCLPRYNFNFKNYTMDGKSYTDYNLQDREIYKITSIPVKLPDMLGDLDVHVYASPNNYITSTVAGIIDLKGQEVLAGADLDLMGSKPENTESK